MLKDNSRYLYGDTSQPEMPDTVLRGQALRLIGPVVYAVRTADGLVKIGFTTNLSMRVRQFGPKATLLALQPGTLDDEQALHSRLSGLAVHGREWYPECSDVMAVVNEMRAAIGLDAA